MATVTPQILAPLKAKMTTIRHDLHRHPELGFEEQQTAGKVAAELRACGLEVYEDIGGTGVVGVLKNGGGNRAIALRADMDALPIQETSTHAYVSQTAGKMHACGHDGHTAMLLGAANYLSNNRNFDGTVVFIFQPNEENGLGAAAMLEDGLFTQFPVEEIYGMHNLPGAPANSFSTREGTICSSESLFEISIQARGGHSAMPQKGVDAILVGSEVVQALQNIVARKLDPGSGCVVSVTEFTTDGKRNVLPGTALLKGDVRARTPEDRAQIKSLMQRILDGIALSHDIRIDFSFETEFIETINASEQTAASVRVAKRLSEMVDGNRSPMSFSEDFALLAQTVPGNLVLIGNGTEGAHGKPLHASDYDFNDEILTTGASYWASLVLERLPLEGQKMTTSFNQTTLSHAPFQRHQGTASEDVITHAAFETAISEITAWEGYEPTPLHHLGNVAQQLGLADILYKDEGPRFGLGSFKALGGAYAAGRVLQREISKRTGTPVQLADIRKGLYTSQAKDITLVSATDGNHGRSLAWGAQRFGANCNIYIHHAVSEGRAEAMRQFGANVIRIDGDYDDSVHLARKEAEENGWFVVSDTSWEGYTDPPLDVMAGYGVMTREITQQMKEPPTHVLLQGGVGGLAASVCSALRQHWGQKAPRVIIVEPQQAACLFESAQSDKITSVEIHEETIMAGLSCGEPSPLAWRILREEASDFIKISDDLVAPAMRLLARPQGNDPVIEGGESAVAGLAATQTIARDEKLKEIFGFDENATILLIGSEGATDKALYEQIIARE